MSPMVSWFLETIPSFGNKIEKLGFGIDAVKQKTTEPML